jgi:hypothetical protein
MFKPPKFKWHNAAEELPDRFCDVLVAYSDKDGNQCISASKFKPNYNHWYFPGDYNYETKSIKDDDWWAYL